MLKLNKNNQANKATSANFSEFFRIFRKKMVVNFSAMAGPLKSN
jgi:hypothetical protein